MSEYRGIVQQGVVVLQGGELPVGTEVTIIPVGIDAPIESTTSTTTPVESPSIWEKLAQLGLEAEKEPCDLPPDFAANHDHYIHGAPKRQ